MKNKHIIIFEGLDGTGKSTIAKKLAEELGLQYFKNHMEHKALEQEVDCYKAMLYMQAPITLAFLSQCSFKENGIILDRFTPSEFAYGHALRGGTDNKIIWEVDKKLAEFGAKIIYCYKYDTLPLNDFSLNECEAIKHYYDIYRKKTKISWLNLNTTSENISYQITEIVHFLSTSD